MVFKEKNISSPLWVVWTEDEEFLFQTGTDALDFVRNCFARKLYAHDHGLNWCPEEIVDGKVVGRCRMS